MSFMFYSTERFVFHTTESACTNTLDEHMKNNKVFLYLPGFLSGVVNTFSTDVSKPTYKPAGVQVLQKKVAKNRYNHKTSAELTLLIGPHEKHYTHD